MKTSIMIIFIATLFLKCKGQEKESLTVAKIDCELLFEEQLNALWDQLASFQSNYLPDENEQNYTWNYDFEKSEITVFKNETPYLNIDFIPIGSIDVIEEKWTWSWANTLKKEVSKLEDVKVFGIENSCEKLKTPTWSGGEKEAWGMVAITNHILKTKGAARHYTKSEYNYVVFTNIQKIN